MMLFLADNRTCQVTKSDERDRDNSLAEWKPTEVTREGDSPRNTTRGSDPRTATL